MPAVGYLQRRIEGFAKGIRMSHAVETATKRIIETYSLMFDPAKAESARAHLIGYLEMLFSAGETDERRLAVCGLAYLRKQNKHANPVSEGFSGL